MNIKNQIRLSVLISLILVVVISASIMLSFQNMQDLRDQESLAADVVRGGYELTYLSNDYLINAEPRARLQWEERYDSLQPVISELKPGNAEEAQSLDTIREYNEKTGTLFREIPEPGTLSAGATLFPASYQQITWSRINVQSQGMIYEAWRLRHLYNNDVSEARFWNNVLVFVLMVLMLIIISINYLLISRRLVRSIREVDAGSREFAAGNLDYRIPLQGTDEIGNIGAGLNAMAAHLKTITASRDELDSEVDQRRRAEEALTAKNADLKAAYEEITANDEELRANYEELSEIQRSLAESERKYRNLYQYAQVGLFETSLKDATVVACNQQYATLAGFSSIADAMGKDILSLYVNAGDRTEVTRILREDGSIQNYTVKFRNLSTGKLFWGQFSARYNFERDVAEGSIVDVTVQKEAEEKIRETNEYLHKLIDFANAPIVIWNPDYTISRFNHAFERITGRTEQEVLGKPLEILFPQEVRDMALASIRRTLEGERWESVRIPVVDRTGSSRTLLWNSANILSAEADLISTIAHGIDITDRERAEEQLKASEHSLSDIVEKLNEAQHIALVGSWEWDLETHHVWWSDETYRIFGVSPQEYVPGFEANGRFIYPDDFEKYQKAFEQSFRTGEPLEVDLRLVAGDGSLKYCHANGKIISDDAGRQVRFIGTMSDITGRKRAEAELAAAQQQYRDLFENVSIGILRSTPGPEGTIIEANPAAVRIFDADSREQLLAVRPSDLYLDHDERRRISEEIVSKGAIESMEVRYRTLKGRAFWGSITSSKKVSDDGKVYFDNTIEDISGRKQAEEALTLEQDFSNTLFDASHDTVFLFEPATGKPVRWNRRFSRECGYTDDEIAGMIAPRDFYDEDDYKKALKAMTGGEAGSFTVELSLVTKQGERIPFEYSATPITFADGRALLLSIGRNITERKRSEDALRASEEKFSTAFKTSPYAITITRIQDGRFIEVNDAFTPITGFTHEEAIAGSSVGLQLWVDAEDRNRVIATLLDGRTVNGEEFLFKRKNGELITGLFSARIISLNNEPCILSSISDISDRKRAEVALRESEAHLLAVLDATPFPIALVDVSDNNIHFWSRSALTLFGHTAPTAAEWFEIAYPDPGYRREVLERWKPALEEARLSGRVVNAGEYRVTCRDGSVRICELYAVFLAERLIVTFNDITERKRSEEARRVSETRFSELFDTASSGIAIYEVHNDGLSGKDYIIQDFNRAALALEGLKKEEVVGKSLLDLRPAIDDYGLIPIFKEVWKTGNPANYPATIYVDEKFTNYYENRVFRLPGGEIVALYDDVTVQKRAEESLRESEEKYREFFTTSRDCVFITSPEGHWIDFNDTAMEMFGYSSREEFALTSLADRYSPPEQRAVFITRIEREGYVKEEPIQLKRKDGSIIETLITAVPLRNPDGTLRALIGTIRDVTEKKKAGDALRETTDYLQNLLDSANAPIIVWDPQFRITRFNHAFERLTGRTEEEVLGRNLALLFPVLSRETSLEQIQKTLAGERWESVEIPILPVSGETRIVLWNSANIVDPTGTVISTIAQGLDITDRKLTEVQRERLIAELEQKNAELERFTYTVSHDLKSPLITIKGFAGLLEDDARKGDPVQLKKDIQRITDAADTMQDLLVDLIELSRVGKIIKPPQKIPFGSIAHEAVNLLAGPLTERDVSVSIAPDMPVVNVDNTRIREVMVNLLENAVKFLGDRTDPEIRIGVDTTEKTPVFFVQDNGVGINPRYLERIFNLFERLDAAAPGTGIGLTIARRIIEVHGGKIWAESEGPGKGTTFRFTLPGPAE